MGPAYVSQAFISLVEQSRKKTIVNVSSTLGSIGSDMGQVFTSYAIVKAGLNMLVRLHFFLSLHLSAIADLIDASQTYKQAKEQPDITVITICPGHLQTGASNVRAAARVSVRHSDRALAFTRAYISRYGRRG